MTDCVLEILRQITPPGERRCIKELLTILPIATRFMGRGDYAGRVLANSCPRSELLHSCSKRFVHYSMALSICSRLGPFGLMFSGTALGIVVGAIPGLTGAMLIALALPLTFAMDGPAAMVLLVSMYIGSISGGIDHRHAAADARHAGVDYDHARRLSPRPKRPTGPGVGVGDNRFVRGRVGLVVFFGAVGETDGGLATRLGPFEFFSLVLMALGVDRRRVGRFAC